MPARPRLRRVRVCGASASEEVRPRPRRCVRVRGASASEARPRQLAIWRVRVRAAPASAGVRVRAASVSAGVRCTGCWMSASTGMSVRTSAGRPRPWPSLYHSTPPKGHSATSTPHKRNSRDYRRYCTMQFRCRHRSNNKSLLPRNNCSHVHLRLCTNPPNQFGFPGKKSAAASAKTQCKRSSRDPSRCCTMTSPCRHRSNNTYQSHHNN